MYRSVWIFVFFSSTLFGQELPRYNPSAEELLKNYSQADRLGNEWNPKAVMLELKPNWIAGASAFWYRKELPKGEGSYWIVDAIKKSKDPAFDAEKLTKAILEAKGPKLDAKRLTLDGLRFDPIHSLHFNLGPDQWTYDTQKNIATNLGPKAKSPDGKKGNQSSEEQDETDSVEIDASQEGPRRKSPRNGEANSIRSPDGKWSLSIRDFNLFLKPTEGEEKPLTSDGSAKAEYGRVFWSPDSKYVVAYKIEPGENKEVFYVESSPVGGGRAKLHSYVYPLPGDRFANFEGWLFDVQTRKTTKIDAEKIDFHSPYPRWTKSGKHFTYEKTDRGHQRFRIIEVDVSTGKSRTLFDDQAKTFINTYANFSRVYHEVQEEIIVSSERSGWNHLYLVDMKTGAIKNPITQGEFVVRNISHIDFEKRFLEFRACGKVPDQDPYLSHFYRVNFDGTGLIPLTVGNGTHTLTWSPDRRFYVDTWSRIDFPPVHELRSGADGSLILALETADISALKGTRWRTPEVFTAKGRDGKTDIWGTISRPSHFDPKLRYPVIEYIYAGPHDSHVPKAFRTVHGRLAIAELGFIVVQCDGMGTLNRSKAFHDVCWQNIADAGFPDRIAWIKAAAKKYPQMDISSVGIFGTSAGGQSSTGALLFHGDFYKVAVSSCGCHDNRMDKSSWNEQWMGVPVGPHYAAQSNITNAHKLTGKLFLIVGEMDTNVPPESTYRLADALIKAKKDFDFLMVPGLGHSDGGSYGERKRRDFFVKHLLGVEPPNWNAAK